MAFILKNMNFVRTLIILLLAISLCNANMRFVKTRFTQNKIVKTSHTTLQNISSIWCVYICYKRQQTGGCTLAGYNKVTQTCCLSSDDPKNVLDTTDEMSGVFFYKPEPTGVNCTTDEPLLNGATPVPNSYFTASSEIDLTHAAYLSRLDGTDKRWTPTEADRDLIPPTLFLQVRFHALSTVMQVATKGGWYWTIQYRLAYSEDCLTFANLLDGAGNNATFPANTDTTTLVENQLPTPITAQCLRFHPLTWHEWPDVKIEVYGCPAISRDNQLYA